VSRTPRDPRTLEEPFILTAMLSLAGASLWLALRPGLLLEYFYAPELLALTHLLTLGFVTGISMGVLQRLLPTLLKVGPRSRRLGGLQLLLFLVGGSGMVFHFARGGWVGMGWATLLVLGAALVQLVNLRDVWRPARDGSWLARYACAALVGLVLAACVGALIGMNKALALETSLLPGSFLGALYAHVHLAALGWATNLILGVELELLPSSAGEKRWLPFRFWAFQAGVAGLAASLLFEWPGSSLFASAIAMALVWHAWGPTRHFLSGRVREPAVIALWALLLCGAAGWAMAAGLVPEAHPWRPRLQAAYGYLGLVGWVGLTVVAMAFKLFPMWVWKECFQADFGHRPVPGMKELYDHRLKTLADWTLVTGIGGVSLGTLTGWRPGVAVGAWLVFGGVIGFLANFVRVARWELLKLEFRPSAADWEKFRFLFPDREGRDEGPPESSRGDDPARL
jgi:hypothetical protein